MLRRQGRALGLALALLVWVGAPARAQDLTSEIAARVGHDVDLRSDLALRDRLLAHGLIGPEDFTLHVTPEVVSRVFAVERFYNHVFVSRYHVGDRILIQDDGSGGSISNRAEIAGILPDGRYQVKVWDKAEALTHPRVSGHVSVFDGKAPSGTRETRILVHDADGSTHEETTATPWLVRDSEREEILTHEQVEKLNGVVRPKAPYRVNGWTIDPANDPVLAERIAKAKAAADEILPASALELPEDPKARKAKLDEIAHLQEKLLDRVFKDNFIDHPGNEPAASARMRDYVAKHPEMSGKVGAVLASRCGVCTDQAAAMVAILNEVAPRAGFSALAIGGSTIKERAGHGFVEIRFANGQLGMYDVTWHFEYESKAVDNLDFATYDERPDSNRTITWTAEETTDKTPFLDRQSERAHDVYRGYDHAAGEAYLAAVVRERAEREGLSVKDAAAKVLGENHGNERIAGTFAAHEVAARAEKIGPRVGFTGPLDGLVDRRLGDRDRAGER